MPTMAPVTPATLRRFVIFVPSLLLGLIGIVWLAFRPLRLEADVGLATTLLAATLLTAALLGAALILDRILPSFRHASRLLERALSGIRLTLPLSMALAATTAGAEEIFFRGALLSTIGVWPQAVLFGLMHPATRRGWSYTAFAFVAGLSFGYVTLWTGSLWAALLAHFVINLQGFLELRERGRRSRSRFGAPSEPYADASGSSGVLQSPPPAVSSGATEPPEVSPPPEDLEEQA